MARSALSSRRSSTPAALAAAFAVRSSVVGPSPPVAMMTGIPRVLAYVSRVMTIEPGDLVLTGTPEGVGPLTAGDHLVIEIQNVGRLSVRVAGAMA